MKGSLCEKGCSETPSKRGDVHSRKRTPFSGGFHNGTVGRAYYAMFHAATAALLAQGIERTSHHAIISAFGEFLAKPGLVDEKFHRYIIEAFTLRNDCDYLAPLKADESQAAATLQRAREFVATCQNLCK